MPPLAPDHPQIRNLVLDSGSDSDSPNLHTSSHAQSAADQQTGTVLADDSDDGEVIILFTQSVPTSSLRTPTQDFDSTTKTNAGRPSSAARNASTGPSSMAQRKVPERLRSEVEVNGEGDEQSAGEDPGAEGDGRGLGVGGRAQSVDERGEGLADDEEDGEETAHQSKAKRQSRKRSKSSLRGQKKRKRPLTVSEMASDTDTAPKSPVTSRRRAKAPTAPAAPPLRRLAKRSAGTASLSSEDSADIDINSSRPESTILPSRDNKRPTAKGGRRIVDSDSDDEDTCDNPSRIADSTEPRAPSGSSVNSSRVSTPLFLPGPSPTPVDGEEDDDSVGGRRSRASSSPLTSPPSELTGGRRTATRRSTPKDPDETASDDDNAISDAARPPYKGNCRTRNQIPDSSQSSESEEEEELGDDENGSGEELSAWDSEDRDDLDIDAVDEDAEDALDSDESVLEVGGATDDEVNVPRPRKLRVPKLRGADGQALAPIRDKRELRYSKLMTPHLTIRRGANLVRSAK